MENIPIVLLSLVCFLLAVLLVIVTTMWRTARKDLKIKQTEINERLAEIKIHQAEINRKETVIQNEKSKRRQIAVSYFTESDRRNHYFRKKHIVRYKMQLVIDGIPVGTPFTIKEDRDSEANVENINKILDEFAQPLLKMGIDVTVSRYSRPFKKNKLKK